MSKARRLLLLPAVALVIVVLYLVLWPVAISPQAWTPPAAPPRTGQYQQNSSLASVERLSLGLGETSPGYGFGPEDVALDGQNRIYAGLDDGRIMRLQADGTRPEVFSNTQGRPL